MENRREIPIKKISKFYFEQYFGMIKFDTHKKETILRARRKNMKAMEAHFYQRKTNSMYGNCF